MSNTGLLSATDHKAMARAVQLAKRGLWTTSPNPRVGCVLMRDGEVVGEGFHFRAGEPHAEVHALREAGDKARNATAYVTLEPCSHHGRTPPCAQALIVAGVARVVVAMEDPNPQVCGQGIAGLRQAGIAVDVGLMAAEACALNPGFISRMQRKRPWVRLKMAGSLDGKTALPNGQSQWITGPEARKDGHRFRAQACAILTGAGTALADDPRLDVRDVGAQRQPRRILVDSHLRVLPNARLWTPTPAGAFVTPPPLVACLHTASAERRRALESVCITVLDCPEHEGRVDLPFLLEVLAGQGVNELHVEAGATLAGGLVRQGLVDEWLIYLAPCFLGEGRGFLEELGLEHLGQAPSIEITDVRQIGPDIRIRATRPLLALHGLRSRS
jgi:diaminohydroxyphosphoribosylaminopyrimidine deaminase / 5-amino-6-(5-phosphoribosylamino)uracil reductase